MICVFIFAILVVLPEQGLGQGNNNAAPVYCPVCSDPYDYTTCTGSFHCNHDKHSVCELHVHLEDRNRIEYHCGNSHACENHQLHCTAGNDMCAYCCVDPAACQNQLTNLFTTKYHTVRPQPTTTVAAATTTKLTTVTTTPATATTSTTTTVGTSATTAAVTTTKAATSAAAASTTLATSQISAKPTSALVTCATCGDLRTMTSCSTLEIIAPPTQVCFSSAPFCFTTLVQAGSNVTIIKGCMDQPSCDIDWLAASATDPACDHPDVSTMGHVDCTYCCTDSLCNVKARPDDITLL